MEQWELFYMAGRNANRYNFRDCVTVSTKMVKMCNLTSQQHHSCLHTPRRPPTLTLTYTGHIQNIYNITAAITTSQK